MAVTGTDKVLRNLENLKRGVEKGASRAVTSSTSFLQKRVKKNISLTGRSLKQLAEMGHPYAVRNPFSPHPGPPFLVHKQTGRLLRAVRSGVVSATGKVTGKVGVDETAAPYARAVIMGTRKMVARDFLRGSLKEVKSKVRDTVRDDLRKTVKEFKR